MSQVKQCMNFYIPSEVEPPQAPVPRQPLQILCDRLYSVEGCDGNTNDIVFTAFPQSPRLNVIYFGGDIQNFSELMNTDRDCNKFREEFNLESIGQLLMKRFNEIHFPVHVWIIRPCKYINEKYVIYKGFLPMNNDGVPHFSGTCFNYNLKAVTAIPHLQALLSNACKLENEKWSSSFGNICTTGVPSIIIGFSKGGVVVTKILFEIQIEILNRCLSPLTLSIREMYWLDSGHNGEECYWPRDFLCFQRITGCPELKLLTFHAYATPFQIGRPIKLKSCQEFSQLTEILLKLGVRHSAGYLLRGDEINLQTHFDIIKAFPIRRH